MRAIGITITILVISLTFCGLGWAQNPKLEVYVIGDSLSDPGNLHSLTGHWPPSPPYAERYSNGPVWTEYLGAYTGLPVQSYAYGGALSGIFSIEVAPGYFMPVSNFNTIQVPPAIPDLPGVSEGIDELLADYPEGLNPDALYVVWAGGNDFFLALGNPATSELIFQQTLSNLVNAVCRLGSGGARHFAVGNITNMGATPYAQGLGPEAASQLSYMVSQLNQALEETLLLLPGECAETMVVLDTYDYLTQVFNDPESFGLSDVSSPCIYSSGGGDCSNHLFWDTVHPTTAGQSILADFLWADFCGVDGDSLGVRGRPGNQPPAIWRGACYGTP